MSDPHEPAPPPTYPGAAPIPRPAPPAPPQQVGPPLAQPPAPYYAPVEYPAAPEPYAHWWRRVAATLLDALLQVPFLVVMFIGTALLGTSIDDTGQVASGGALAAGMVLTALGLVSAIAFDIWNRIFRQGRRGASIGKQWLAIMVVGESDGRPIGALMTFVRQLCHIVDALLCYIGYLWPLWDHKRQTFADKIMSTVVLYLPPEP